MRILVIGSTFPFPPRSGFETRFANIVRQLARWHDVTLLAYVSGDERPAEAWSDEVRVEVVQRRPPSRGRKRRHQLASLVSSEPFAVRATRSSEMQAAIDRLCTQTRVNAVQVESVLLLGLRLPAGMRLVLDEHNIEYEVFARMRAIEQSVVRKSFYGLEQARMRTFEQSAWKRVDGCVVTSERERDLVRSVAPETPTAVVPNGVDLDYFRPQGLEVDDRSIVFNGVLDYHPNVDAADFLVGEILPLVRRQCPGVQLTIVGRGSDAQFERLRQPDIQILGEVPDVRPFLERAAVVVVPVRMGGGTRLKVVEALALEKGIVSTTLGCEGIDVRPGEHLLVADTAEAFAAEIARLLEDPALAQRLGRAGRRLASDRYSWDAAGETLAALYRSLEDGIRVREVPAALRGS